MQSLLVCQLLPKLAFIFQMMGIPRPDSLRRILCEGTDLDEYVQFSSQGEKEAFQNVSCSLTPQQLINTQQVLLQNLDARKVLSEVSFSSCPPHKTSKSHNLSNLSLMKFEGTLHSNPGTVSLILTKPGESASH